VEIGEYMGGRRTGCSEDGAGEREGSKEGSETHFDWLIGG
jgi:hypothetical protein